MASRMVHGPSRHDVAVSRMSYIDPVMHRLGWDDNYDHVTACGQWIQDQRGWAVGLPIHFSPAIRECRRCFPAEAGEQRG